MFLFFSLIERYFFMHCYLLFQILKVLYDFASLPKAAICKAIALRVRPKEEKCHFFFLSNRMAGIFSCIFTCHFIFPKSLSILPTFQNQHFARLKRIEVRQRRKSVTSFFSVIE